MPLASCPGVTDHESEPSSQLSPLAEPPERVNPAAVAPPAPPGEAGAQRALVRVEY
jgi:hypothetical protein